MHRARAFFFVCAGLFLLALSYHLGARNAGAQAGATVGEISWNYGAQVAAVQGRTIYTVAIPNPPDGGFPVQTLAPVPGASPIIAVDAVSNSALLENGDVYVREGGGWVLKGNLFGGGPVPVQRETFGSLKVRYHGERRAAQPAPQGR